MREICIVHFPSPGNDSGDFGGKRSPLCKVSSFSLLMPCGLGLAVQECTFKKAERKRTTAATNAHRKAPRLEAYPSIAIQFFSVSTEILALAGRKGLE